MDNADKKLYRLYEDGPVNMWETSPIAYIPNPDGLTVTAGSLVNSGFTPGYERGVTLPYDIDGIPITELRGHYSKGDIGFIEARRLKRAYLEIVDNGWRSSVHDPMICQAPSLVGGCQNTIEEMQLRFVGENLSLGSFEERDYLTSVEFIGNVLPHCDWDSDYIDSGAFKNCRRLRRVAGALKAKWLLGGVFDGCESLVYLPDIHVKGIYAYVFRNCRSLSRIHLHNGLMHIGSSVFENCVSLNDIYIPDTVTELGEHLFKNCSGLQSLHLPDGLPEIATGMFYGCCALKKVFLPNNLTEIKDEAFDGCVSMSSPWIPNGLKTIGSKAFRGCTSMKIIYIPNSVQSIGDRAFENCADLTIRGNVGSFAQEYARKQGIPFVGV